MNMLSTKSRRLISAIGEIKKRKTTASFEDSQFSTEVDVNIYDDLLKDGVNLKSLSSKKAVIKWNASFEAKTWGIKGILIVVPDQTITIQGEDESNESLEVVEISLPIQNIDSSLNTSEYFSISPTSLDYFKGRWTLEF